MKFFKEVACVAIIAFATTVFAQEAKLEEKIPEKPKTQVGGLAYLEWSKELKHSSTSQTENTNTFAIKRVYLDFKKKFDEVWSVRVTTDVGQVESEGLDNSSTLVKSKTNPYTMYIKYAYIEAKQKFDVVAAKLRFGMVGTPLIGFVDKYSDYRWLEQNYADQAKTVLTSQAGKGESIDHSADMGLSLEVSLFNKLLTLTGAYTNGEGYKYADEVKLGDDGKAYYGLATIMPINDLYIIGVYRNQETNDMIDDNYNRYYGGGLVYSDELFKLGAMYLLPEVSSKASSTATAVAKNEYKLFDSWLNIRLDTIISMPVIVVGRYAFGKNKDVDKSKITSWAAGLGYHVANGLRAVVYFQNIKNEALDDPDRKIFVKTEVKF